MITMNDYYSGLYFVLKITLIVVFFWKAIPRLSVWCKRLISREFVVDDHRSTMQDFCIMMFFILISNCTGSPIDMLYKSIAYSILLCLPLQFVLYIFSGSPFKNFEYKKVDEYCYILLFFLCVLSLVKIGGVIFVWSYNHFVAYLQ